MSSDGPLANADAPAPSRRPRGSVVEVFLAFLKLGLTSFGGPIAHLGYFRDELITRRRWVDDRAYADLVALCQFLPGPASSQVGFGLGMLRAGAGGALAAFVAKCPQGRLALSKDDEDPDEARFGLSKETIRAQARSVGLVVHENAECGVFTLLSTVNRPERWALFSEAEDLSRLAGATAEALAPSAAVEPAPLAAVLAPVPAAAPRTEEELFAYVREVYVRAAQQGGGSAGERLAALRAAGVATDEEAQNILARLLARAESTPTQLEALRAAGIPPPPPREEGWVEGGSTAARNAIEALRAAGIPPPPPPPPQSRQSVDLPGFAPARFRSGSPLHDDAAALRERSAADDRAEAGLE